MPARDPIHVAFDRFGRDAGMELHGRAWYLRADEVIVVCDLQKSQYGPSYYLNIGYYLRSTGDEIHPKAYKCDIALRGHVFLGETSDLDELLDLDRPVDDGERSLRLYALLSRLTEPVRRGSSLQGLKDMIADGSIPSYMLKANAQSALLSRDQIAALHQRPLNR